MSNLVKEILGRAVLDSACPQTIAGVKVKAIKTFKFPVT